MTRRECEIVAVLFLGCIVLVVVVFLTSIKYAWWSLNDASA